MAEPTTPQSTPGAAMIRTLTPALPALLWTLAIPAFAATWDVPSEVATIGEALGLAAAGDSVVVAPGTYPELLTLVDGVVLRGSDPGDRPVVDAENSGIPIEASGCGPGTRLEDLIVRNGAGAGLGGGARILSSSLVIERCRFESCSAVHGAGIGADASDFIAIDCEFVANVAQQSGGALSMTGIPSPTITGGLFASNEAFVGGGIAVRNGTSPDISGALLVGNESDHGAAIWWDFLTGGSVEGCTIVGNETTVEDGGTLYFNALAAPLVATNVIALARDGGASYAVAGAAPTWDCNVVWANAGGDSLLGGIDLGTSLTVDPRFCDAGAGDWTVRDDSPCTGGPCGSIGAFGVGCTAVAAPVPAEPVESSWGQVKALYR